MLLTTTQNLFNIPKSVNLLVLYMNEPVSLPVIYLPVQSYRQIASLQKQCYANYGQQ